MGPFLEPPNPGLSVPETGHPGMRPEVTQAQARSPPPSHRPPDVLPVTAHARLGAYDWAHTRGPVSEGAIFWHRAAAQRTNRVPRVMGPCACLSASKLAANARPCGLLWLPSATGNVAVRCSRSVATVSPSAAGGERGRNGDRTLCPLLVASALTLRLSLSLPSPFINPTPAPPAPSSLPSQSSEQQSHPIAPR